MKNEIIYVAVVIFEMTLLLSILVLTVFTFTEIRRDPLDVNQDGEANIVDLSVLAAQLNERGQ